MINVSQRNALFRLNPKNMSFTQLSIIKIYISAPASGWANMRLCLLKTRERKRQHNKLLVFESPSGKMRFFPYLIRELAKQCHLSFFHSLRYNFNSFETALSTAEVSRQMVLFYSSLSDTARGVEAAGASERTHKTYPRSKSAYRRIKAASAAAD